MNYINKSAAIAAVRAFKVKQAVGGDPVAAAAFVRQRGWDADEGRAIVEHMKAGVAGIEEGGVGSGIAINFIAAISAASVPGRLPGVLRFPAHTRLMARSAPVFAGVVVEGASVPVIPGTWLANGIVPIKTGAIEVVSNEALAIEGVDEAIASDLLAAAANGLDRLHS